MYERTSRSHVWTNRCSPVTRERVRQVEPEVELGPLDPPLLVVGQVGAEPVGLGSQLAGDAGQREPAVARVVGDREVAVQVLDDTAHRARADHCRWRDGERPGHAAALCANRSSMVVASCSPSNSLSTD